MSTTRLSPELLAAAEIVGDHPETEEKTEPVTKVVKRTSKGVQHK